MKLFEISSLQKAGIIPYYRNKNGKIKFLFMIPSDSHFGGDQPSIAKGHVEKGESIIRAAHRETAEELGLKKENIIQSTLKLIWSGDFTGKKDVYPLHIYICEVKDKNDFDSPNEETKETVWLTASQFTKEGRKSQVEIVQTANDFLLKK
jgi:8-oxo-dGTP pyrophosphatase MutT (NUDIX family)